MRKTAQELTSPVCLYKQNKSWETREEATLTLSTRQKYVPSVRSLPVLPIGRYGSYGSVQFSSVAQLCLTLFDPLNCSTPGLPVQHQLPEFTQTHVYGVGDAIQPSHPLSSPSPPAPNPSQLYGHTYST